MGADADLQAVVDGVGQGQGLASTVNDLRSILPEFHHSVVLLGQRDVKFNVYPRRPRKDNFFPAHLAVCRLRRLACMHDLTAGLDTVLQEIPLARHDVFPQPDVVCDGRRLRRLERKRGPATFRADQIVDRPGVFEIIRLFLADAVQLPVLVFAEDRTVLFQIVLLIEVGIIALGHKVPPARPFVDAIDPAAIQLECRFHPHETTSKCSLGVGS